MDTTHPQGKGLEILSIDDRDFSHYKKALGAGATISLPDKDFTIYDAFGYTIKWGDTFYALARRFGLSPGDLVLANSAIKDINKIYVGQILNIPGRIPHILNQWDLDFCTAFATAELQYAIFGIPVDPLYQMAKIKQIRGEYASWGANLRDAAQSVVKFGSLPSFFTPYTYSFENPPLKTDKDRNFLANWQNWPTDLNNLAAKDKDLSFFNVDGPYDAFDNIRSALWMHRKERRGVLTGMNWEGEWTYAKDSIINGEMVTGNGKGHAISIIGQRTLDGVPYIVLQQTWGNSFGKNGFYYFSGEAINKIVGQGFGIFAFSRFDKTGFLSSFISALASAFNKLTGKIK